MNKNYFLVVLLLGALNFSFGQIWSENFDSYTDGTGIDGSGNIGDYPGGVTQWSLDVSAATLSATTDWAKTSGGLFSFRDVDGDAIWQSEAIDISGATGPVTFSLEASNNAGGFETSDYYDVYYQVDGGGYTLIANWNSLGDAMHTILGEVGGVDWSTTETITQSGITGNTLEIRVVALNNAGGEEFFIDNISVFEGSAPPALSITSPTNGASFNPETTSVTVSVAVQNFVVATVGSGDGHIAWQLNGNAQPAKYDTNDIILDNSNVDFNTSGSNTVYMELVDDGGTPIAPAVNATTTFTIASYVMATDIAAVRADVIANGAGSYYDIASAPNVTYVRSTRNQKYIQDASAGILIDDVAGTITSPISEGNGITGLKGQTSLFNGVLQLVPTTDVASVTALAPVTPEVVTINDLLTNQENYESELVQINTASFDPGDVGMNFAVSTNYNITDVSGTMVFRTNFAEADYIGNPIPATEDLVVLVGEFNGTPQVTARSINDFVLNTTEFDNSAFSIHPNPVRGNELFITSENNLEKQVTVYSILGKEILRSTITNKLQINSLQSGVYILKIVEGTKVASKRIIVQ